MVISLILYKTNLSTKESATNPTSLFQARARVIRALASPDYKSPCPSSPRCATEGKFLSLFQTFTFHFYFVPHLLAVPLEVNFVSLFQGVA